MKRMVEKILFFILLIFCWRVLSLQVSSLFIPSPYEVLAGLINLIQTGQLFNGILYSLLRVITACILSAIISIIIGTIIYASNPIRRLLFPAIKIMRYMPVTAFYPLLIMWCGIGEKMKVTFLFLVSFVSMMPTVIMAMDNVSEDLKDTGKTLGMNRIQLIRMVILPSASPIIFENFNMMISIGWTYIPFVETINAKYGLGYIIHQSSSRGRTDLVFAAIATIIIISIICDKTGTWIKRKTFKWKRGKKDN